MLPDPTHPVGLCRTCRHVRIVPARAGARYYRCARADDDPRYRKYPVLPVRACDGHEPEEPGAAGLDAGADDAAPRLDAMDRVE